MATHLGRGGTRNRKRKREDEGIALDVSAPDSSLATTLVRRPYNIVTEIHKAREGYRISSVVESGAPIWTSSDGHSCDHVVVIVGENRAPTHLILYLTDGGFKQDCLYYEKRREWVGIQEEDFYGKFHAMVIMKLLALSISFDTRKKYNPKILYVNKSSKFPFAVYAPNSICRIKSVKNGTVIWNAGANDQGCIYASFYPRDTPTLAYLVIHSLGELKGLYYSKMSGSWKSVDKNEYLEDLAKAGFDRSKFSNRITLDISSVDNDLVYTYRYNVHENITYMYTTLPGFSLERIVDGVATIWKAKDTERCTYINVFAKKTGYLGLFMFTTDSTSCRKSLYFRKVGKEWKKVDRNGYYHILVNDDSSRYTHQGDGKIIMSSFKNRQGLRIATYASRVENAKGDFILVHGFRSSFMSEFGMFDMDWNLERFEYPSIPYVDGIFINHWDHLYQTSSSIARYKHLFNYTSLDGLDALEVLPEYIYNNSFIEALNRLGYNVYAMDLQSQGLSGSISDLRCYVNNFKDHVYDLMQFISIVKRGKFGDPNEQWDEEAVYENIPTNTKTFLLAHSMGGNIAVQAVQEFNKHAKEGAKLIDGLVGLSAMLNLDHHLNTPARRLLMKFSKLLEWLVPKTFNPCENIENYGESFDFIMRFMNPFHYSGKCAIKPYISLFTACDDVNREDNMVNYPKDLPTLFVHTRDDYVCGVQGPRDMMTRHLKGSKTAKLVELEGTCHYLNAYQSISSVMPHIDRWLEELSTKPSLSGNEVSTSGELRNQYYGDFEHLRVALMQ
ncbi:conserved hypothetical protein [Theileria equi strain WA]|uniref:Serine aminopeptidase S33 domain-containing protein n=1 Tax=Theileria equi strain WA TaxID=1537102 RepID=L1L9K4_THEEQ|nr:conserved hypothetical protein [Theileria equi strain WA]EKX72102.1 conserved hypothetical protein [Theileria equi strain WA]|eukprot:XP_004831554.1 conserved hypothetical protein [Theileria equi strain WA]